jgi:general secretion pathway protein D
MVLSAACPGERFDVTVKEPIALRDALLSIIDECDLSLTLDGDATEERFNSARVGYISLRAVNAEEAIDFLMKRANLHYTIESDLLAIKYLDTRVFKIDFVSNSRSGTSTADIKIGGAAGIGSSSSGGSSDSSSGDTSTSIKTEEKFDLWGTIEEEVTAIVSRPEDGAAGSNAVVVNPSSGLITVTGTRKQIDRVADYLDQTLKSLKKQVLIDVQIISVVLDGDKHTGIDWGSFPFQANSGSYQYNRDILNSVTLAPHEFNFGAIISESGTELLNFRGSFINFLKTQGETKSLSNPKVLAMNNQPTLISVGDTINYLLTSSTTLSGSSSGSSTQSTEQQSIFVGVLLDITPQIDEDGYITLRMNPSISELKYAEDKTHQSAPRSVAPDTVTRSISSVVRVRDSEVIVLGGLISNFSQVSESKIPLLGDIPFLGKLFGATRNVEQTQEIVFVLSPRIVNDDSQKPTLKDLGYREEMEKQLMSTTTTEMPKMKDFDE